MTGFSGKHVFFDERFLHVDLQDGRRISTPLSWYAELEQASPELRNDWQLICDATGIEWPALDYHLSIAAMLEHAIDVA